MPSHPTGLWGDGEVASGVLVGIRFVSPILLFTNKPYRLWLQRIDAYDKNLRMLLDWIERVNTALFRQFDEIYDG